MTAASGQMQAILSHAPGEVDTVVSGRHPEPVPKPDEILVEVAACGVTYPDVLLVQGRYQASPARPLVPGCEFAGTVIRCGAQVTGFKAGDRVVSSYTLGGGMAERAVAPAATTHHLPDEIDWVAGLALFGNYGTSLHGLQTRAGLCPGETLLVLGASGGVGLAAVQLGKALGARVIAACSSQAKLDIALANGADIGIVYPATFKDSAERRALTAEIIRVAGQGVDVVYDPVGGDLAEAALRALVWKGRYLIVGFAAGIPQVPFNQLLLRGISLIGVLQGRSVTEEPDLYKAESAELKRLFHAGLLRPHAAHVLPMQEAAKALQLLAGRQSLGKVVLLRGPATGPLSGPV